jgi:hypothetical protein
MDGMHVPLETRLLPLEAVDHARRIVYFNDPNNGNKVVDE